MYYCQLCDRYIDGDYVNCVEKGNDLICEDCAEDE